MANPFKEAEKAKKKAPGNKQDPPEKKEEVVKTELSAKAETPAETITEPPKTTTENKPSAKPAGKSEKTEESTAKPGIDIFANLGAEKPTGRTYAFYLSDTNVAKLKKMAEKKGVSASKLLDHILSEIL